MGFLKISSDAFPSSHNRTFLLFLSLRFQSSQLGLLFLDIAALCDFRTSALGMLGMRGIHDKSVRA